MKGNLIQKDKKRIHNDIKLTKVISVVCAIFMILALFPNVSMAASGSENDFKDFITDFTITDKNGDNVSESKPLKPGDELRAKWTFSISPEQQTVIANEIDSSPNHESKLYNLKIPEEFYNIISTGYKKIVSSTFRDQSDVSGDFIFSYRFNSNGTIDIKFKKVEGGNAGGFITLLAKVNSEEEITQKETDVTIDEYENKIDITISTLKVEKSYVKTEGDTILWKITAHPPKGKDSSLAGCTLKDTIKCDNNLISIIDQVYLGSVSSGNNITRDVTMLSKNSFTYTFPKDIPNGDQVIYVKTKVNKEDTEYNTNYRFHNSVSLKKDDVTVYASADHNENYTILDKNNGNVVTENGKKYLEYKVDINKNRKDMGSNIIVTDTLPIGTSYEDGTLKIRIINPNNTYGNWITIDKSLIKKYKGDNQSGDKIIIDLSKVIDGINGATTKDQYQLKYRINYDYKNIDNSGKRLNNTVEITSSLISKGKDTSSHNFNGSGGNGNTKVNINKSGELISKGEVEKITNKTGLSEGNYVLWSIDIGRDNVKYSKKDGKFIFKDKLPEGLTYVDGSLKITPNNIMVSYDEATREFSASIYNPFSGKIKISFITKITGTRDSYTNTAYIDDKNSSATVKIGDISKWFDYGSFNYNEMKFYWNICFNANKSYLNNPYLIDTLPEGHQLCKLDDGSYNIKVTDNTGSSESYVGKDTTPWKLESYNEETRQVKITWVGNPKYITDKYDFKICTEFTKKGMDDYYKSSDNSNKYTNTVSYNADGIEGSTSCDAWINKHATLVKGFKEYTSENRIHWTIQMYQNKIDTLNNAELVDKLPEKGLIFIPSSVKIYRGHMYPGGYFSKDDNDLVDDSEYVVNYDVANAQFTIKFNNPIKRGTIYFVEYDTTITTDSIKNEVNKVTLKGKDITDVTVQSNVINVDVQSGAWSDKLSLNIVKKNSSKDKNLSGAVFKITCNNTNKSENFTTDSSGSIQKLNYLISGYKYTITEIKAPNGYVLDKTPIVFIAGNSGESANYNNATIQYNEKNRIQIITITNDQILSQFSFIKISGTNDSDKGKPLEGVQFKLYKKLVDDPNGIHDKADEDLSDNNVWEIYDTQYSLNNGSVTFSNLSAGSYRLVEIKTVQGYELPAGSWKIEVFSENGQVSKPLAIGLAPAFQLSPTRCKEPSYYLCNYKNVMVPITGSRGIVFPIFIGFMVAIGSVVVIIKSKKDLNYKNK